MNYFSLREIFLGAVIIFACGTTSAFLAGSLRLCLLSKDAFLALFRQLYKNRSKLRLRAAWILPEQSSAGRIDEFFVDFFAVLFLFFGYLLSSYVFFDGVFRVIYLFPLLLGYWLFSRLILPHYTRVFLFFLHRALLLLSAILSVPIFFLYLLLRVLKLPILYIIRLVRLYALRITSPALVRRWKAQIEAKCEDALKNALNNI